MLISAYDEVRYMKKVFPLLSLVSIISLFVPAPVFAANNSLCPTGEFAPLCNLDLSNSSTIVGNTITILLIVGVILALFFLIIGAIRWITSSGDKAKVESARNTIVAAIVGLILAFLAFFILNTITYLFTKNTIRNFKVPTIIYQIDAGSTQG